MKDNFKKTYDFDIRFATRSEIKNLSEYLAKKKWEDYQKNKNTTAAKSTKKEAVDFIRKEKIVVHELIGTKVLVQDYKKFNVSIFVFNYIQEHDKNTILSMTFRVLQTERGMESLESDDAIFELNVLKKRPYHQREHKTGRHDRPKNESIQKTIEIRKYLNVNPKENRDRVCNEFGLSKTTYYRVLKWLEDRKN
ncbi:hypothetical protein [Aquimarina macrocephali]|uniref:hypothetical protein n=1 Tax=Aquimarina macrocephali TaxID=666563 RepID=UPI000464D036|nr:hypothetical protein [Aquimarina macrocephali]